MNWKVKTCFLPLCAAAFIVMVADDDARAAVIDCGTTGSTTCTETETFSMLGTDDQDSAPIDGSDTLVFNLFDGDLGTLTSVSVTIESGIDILLKIDKIELEGAEGSGTSDHDAEVNSSTLGATGLSIFSDTLSEACDSDIGTCPNTVEKADIVKNGNLFALLFLSDPVFPFSSFIGVGTFDIDLASEASITACDKEGNFPLACDASTSWFGEITVAYGFTPTPPPTGVPEPATLGLFGVGLAGLAFLRRRRRAGVIAERPR